MEDIQKHTGSSLRLPRESTDLYVAYVFAENVTIVYYGFTLLELGHNFLSHFAIWLPGFAVIEVGGQVQRFEDVRAVVALVEEEPIFEMDDLLAGLVCVEIVVDVVYPDIRLLPL